MRRANTLISYGWERARKQVQPDLTERAIRREQQRVARERALLDKESATREQQEIELLSTLWNPLPGPQTHARDTLADELFYGGAAGGGKTDLLLGLAMTQHYKSLILRREGTQLRAIIERMRELLGKVGRFNENTKIWRGIPGGRIIELGGCPTLNDRTKFMGRPDDLKGFDELGEWLKDAYTFIIAWNRTARVGVRSRVVATGNPPTSAQGEWVIERWGAWLDDQHANPATPGELRWYTTIKDKDVEVESGKPFEHNGELVVPRSRTFIPASVDDNPYYLATGYKAMLQATPEPLRSQLLYGDFKSGREDSEWQVIPTLWIIEAQRRWLQRAAAKDVEELRAVGVDVARGGRDKTVFAPLYGCDFLGEILVFPGAKTKDGPTVSRLFRNQFGERGRGLNIFVDVIGYGASAYDYLREHYHALRDEEDDEDSDGKDRRNSVFGVNFGVRSKRRDKSGKLELYNVRADAFWNLRELLDPTSGNEICLPPDSELKADLCAITYRIQSGRILCESKDEIKERLGRSTDKGDACALAFFPSRRSVSSTPHNVGLPASATSSKTVAAITSPAPEIVQSSSGLFTPVPTSSRGRGRQR